MESVPNASLTDADRAGLAIIGALALRIERLLSSAYNVLIFVPSDQLDWVYAQLTGAIERALEREPVAIGIRDQYPKDALPRVLWYANFQDSADSEWRYGYRPAMAEFIGAVHRECVRIGANPYDPVIDTILKGYDDAILAYQKLHDEHEEAFIADLERRTRTDHSADDSGKKAQRRNLESRAQRRAGLRQAEARRLRAEGLRLKEIAQRLGVSERRVSQYLSDNAAA